MCCTKCAIVNFGIHMSLNCLFIALIAGSGLPIQSRLLDNQPARTLTMSRPARYGGKSYSEKSAYNQNGGGAGDTVAASALTKAHAQYNEPLAQLQAIFSDWKEDDLLSILEDTRGDVETAVARISEGSLLLVFFFMM